jgi:hypothetical protein
MGVPFAAGIYPLSGRVIIRVKRNAPRDVNLRGVTGGVAASKLILLQAASAGGGFLFWRVKNE